MLDNKKLLITVVSLALIGVLALFVYSTTIKPVKVELESIDSAYIGKIITTNGTINSARILSDGSLSMEICDFDSLAKLKVYFPASIYEAWNGGNLTPGTTIEVTGEVIQYQEEMEISIASSDDLVVLSGPGFIRYDLWTIMDSVELFDGMEIRTNGSILDISKIESSGELVGTGFTLYQRHNNQSYSLNCIVFDRDLTDQYFDWNQINVIGDISFYTNTGSWQLVVDVIEPG